MIIVSIGRQPEFVGCRVIKRCDEGLSGTRPQFTDMIGLAKQGKVDCIIVKDCSRFGRNYVEPGDYLEHLLPFLGMRFISVIDHYNSERDEGRLAWERLTAQGKYMAGQALYGYRKKKKDKHKLEPDPETEPVFLHGKRKL